VPFKDTGMREYADQAGQRLHPGSVCQPEPNLKLAIEGVHQLRVATRRMRSCLQLYRPLIPKTVSSAINNGIRRAADALGQAF
jgi:CHAD domain-containing protein